MKIMQLLPELNEGGVERGVVELNRELVKRGIDSVVMSAGGKLAGTIEKDGGRHIIFDLCSKNPLTAMTRVRRLREILNSVQPDILHARSRVPAWLTVFANRKLQIPFVTTVHGYNSVNAYSRVMTYGDMVICVSTGIKAYIQQHYSISDDKMTVIHRGVDPELFNPSRVNMSWLELFQKEHCLSNKYIVTSVGRITELKDYETFIHAVKDAAEAIPNICGLIVGGVRHDKQAYFERLKKLVAELGAEEQIVFAGSQSEIAAIYALSNALVSCSKKPESFGRTLIEAMAMNTPVIATRHGGALDIIEEGKNGFLFEPGNVAELAEALKRQKELPSDGLREYVLSRFSLAQMVEKTVAVYVQLLKKISSER